MSNIDMNLDRFKEIEAALHEEYRKMWLQIEKAKRENKIEELDKMIGNLISDVMKLRDEVKSINDFLSK